jgi:hypothetical protein
MKYARRAAQTARYPMTSPLKSVRKGVKNAPAPALKTAAWSEILALFGPITVLTALLYYFGYVSSAAFYSYFGINQAVLDLSPTQYLLNSTESIFRPLATIPILAATVFLLHHIVERYLIKRKPWARRGITLTLFALGCAFAIVSLVGLYVTVLGYWAPLSMAAAGLCLEYGAWNAIQPMGLSARSTEIISSGRQLRRGVVAALLLIAAFWAVTNVANRRGADAATLFQTTLRIQPQAVVFSAEDQHLTGPGVQPTMIAEPDSAYHFRYNGLRTLLHSDGRWYLLPVGWSATNGATVFILPDNPQSLRVDLAPSS